MKIKIERIDIDPDKIIEKRGLALGGATQKYLESTVLRYCQKYIPKDTGALINSGTPWPHSGGGYVGWFTPYAHYMYEGEIYGPNIPKFDESGEIIGWWSPPTKYPTGRPIQYVTSGRPQANPQAGSHWVERMMANDGDELLKEVAEYAGGKAK